MLLIVALGLDFDIDIFLREVSSPFPVESPNIFHSLLFKRYSLVFTKSFFLIPSTAEVKVLND